jgi:hypothetical protein
MIQELGETEIATFTFGEWDRIWPENPFIVPPDIQAVHSQIFRDAGKQKVGQLLPGEGGRKEEENRNLRAFTSYINYTCLLRFLSVVVVCCSLGRTKIGRRRRPTQ